MSLGYDFPPPCHFFKEISLEVLILTNFRNEI